MLGNADHEWSSVGWGRPCAAPKLAASFLNVAHIRLQRKYVHKRLTGRGSATTDGANLKIHPFGKKPSPKNTSKLQENNKITVLFSPPSGTPTLRHWSRYFESQILPPPNIATAPCSNKTVAGNATVSKNKMRISAVFSGRSSKMSGRGPQMLHLVYG